MDAALVVVFDHPVDLSVVDRQIGPRLVAEVVDGNAVELVRHERPGVANVAGRVPRRFTLRANVLEDIEASAAERGVTRWIGRKVRREAGPIVG